MKCDHMTLQYLSLVVDGLSYECGCVMMPEGGGEGGRSLHSAVHLALGLVRGTDLNASRGEGGRGGGRALLGYTEQSIKSPKKPKRKKWIGSVTIPEKQKKKRQYITSKEKGVK